MEKKKLDPIFNLIKKLVLSYLVKAGLAASGPVNWVAAFMLNRALKPLQVELAKYLTWIEGQIAIQRQKEIDEKNRKKYEESLQDGKTEQQLDSDTSDFLNGRK